MQNGFIEKTFVDGPQTAKFVIVRLSQCTVHLTYWSRISSMLLIADGCSRVGWRRSRRLNTVQVKQLQDGEAIHTALTNSPDPLAFQVTHRLTSAYF